jgi:hypothetical protein
MDQAVRATEGVLESSTKEWSPRPVKVYVVGYACTTRPRFNTSTQFVLGGMTCNV